MKTKFFVCIIAFSLSTGFAFSQIQYMNTDFEKTDTVGKSVMKFQTITRDIEFMLDSVYKFSGNYSLYFHHDADSSGQSFLIYLPKTFYKGMRSLQVSVKIRENGTTIPRAGIWSKVKKNKKLIGWASTYKGQLAFPMDITEGIMSQNIPIIPWSWTSYSFNIKIEEDPDEVIIGGFGIYSAWFDDFEISINGIVLNNLAIPLQMLGE